MVNYKPVKITIDAPDLAKIILDIIIWHHGLLNSIMSNRSSVFISKFWSSLCYFLEIKQRLSTAFHPQINSQTKRQNSTIEAYLRAFVNYKQNDWARLFSIAKFAYNNAKNTSIGHTPFELNYGYHPCVFYIKDINCRSRFKSANELLTELQELMFVYRKNLYYTQKL